MPLRTAMAGVALLLALSGPALARISVMLLINASRVVSSGLTRSLIFGGFWNSPAEYFASVAANSLASSTG